MTSPQSQRGRDPWQASLEGRKISRDSQDLSHTGNRSGQHLITRNKLSAQAGISKPTMLSVSCDFATSLSFPSCDWPQARRPRTRCAPLALPQPPPGSHAPQTTAPWVELHP